MTPEEKKAKRRARYIAHREANRERELARAKAYYAANRERALAKQKAYAKDNREAIRERVLAAAKTYYAANRVRVAAYKKAHSSAGVASLSDQYVYELLTQDRTLHRKQVTPQLIELKRMQLQIHRANKTLTQPLKEKE